MFCIIILTMSQTKGRKIKKRKYRLKKSVKLILVILILFVALLFLIVGTISLFKPKHDYNVELKQPITELPISYLDISKLKGEDFKYYEDDTTTSTLGIDVSMHQKSINWNKVKESGITFAYIRCGYRGYQGGKLYEDPTFRENIEGAKAAGLNVGVYFFSQAINEQEAIDEAYFTHELIKDYEIDLPVVYDLEEIDYDISRLHKIANTTRTNNAISFCAKMEELGYQPMIYANIYWLNSVYDINSIMNYPLWIADYDNIPSFEYEFKLWQYSEDAKIEGIDEPVDINLMLIPK